VSPPAQPRRGTSHARRPLAWVRLLAGLWLFAVGVVLGLRSGLGVSPWDVLHDGIRQATPLSFGAATVLVGVVLVVVALAAGVRPGPGTLVNMVAIGVFVDALLASGLVDNLAGRAPPVRLAAVLAGVGLVALGSALYIGAGLGSGPRDSLMLALAARTRLPVGLIRGLLEGSVLGVGWRLGGVVGLGTVLFAFGIGPAVQLAFRVLQVDLPREPNRRRGRETVCLECCSG
jgi:uncharacterized membrane protein YczE